LVNGAASALVTTADGRHFAVIAFTVRDGRIAEIDGIVGRKCVGRIAAAVLG
jgi:hypothetical protein